jgi:DNA-binding MurR/RpiR family transcriptional regulator
MKDDDVLAQKLLTILPYLNEKQRRLVLAAEARSLGYGGVSQVARATGVSRPTIDQGLQELDTDQELKLGIRRAGGGRKRVEELDVTLLEDLEQLVDPDSRGDPMSPLR